MGQAKWHRNLLGSSRTMVLARQLAGREIMGRVWGGGGGPGIGRRKRRERGV